MKKYRFCPSSPRCTCRKKGTLVLKHFNIMFQIRYLFFLCSFTWQVVLEPTSSIFFYIGDAVTGTTSVIKAIAAGRKGAIVVDEYLGGSGMLDEELASLEEPVTWLGREENFAFQHRSENSCMPVEQRLSSFCEIVHYLDEQAALEESQRCLQCDLRLKIKPVKFWGDY